MPAVTGSKLSDITFEIESLSFTGSSFTVPSGTNGGEFGDSDNQINVYIDGSLIYPTTDYSVNRGTAGAHQIDFVNAQSGVDLFIKFIAV